MSSPHGITAFLTPPGSVTGNSLPPRRPTRQIFQGSYVLGMGFVLEPEEAQRLIEKDTRNKDVLFPYLNGEDLNSRARPVAEPLGHQFFDWPLDQKIAPQDYTGPVAADYPDCLEIIEKVKPERMTITAERCAERSGGSMLRKQPELYRAIAGIDDVLVTSRVSKYLSL